MRAILYLLVVVFILLFGYALAFHLLFRTSYPQFASIGASLMTVVRSVLGDFPVIELEGTNSLLARILFISYMVVLFFVVLNMFIAVLSEVAHVYSLQPSLDEYREWAKMKRLLLEMFCCCFGYGQNGDSVVDDDDDDDADREVEEEALAAYGRDRAAAMRDRIKEREAVKQQAREAAMEVCLTLSCEELLHCCTAHTPLYHDLSCFRILLSHAAYYPTGGRDQRGGQAKPAHGCSGVSTLINRRSYHGATGAKTGKKARKGAAC